MKFFAKVCALLSVSTPAFAYLDPGTGSMVLQIILGGFAAIGVALKLYWYRIKAFFGFKSDSPPGTGDHSAD